MIYLKIISLVIKKYYLYTLQSNYLNKGEKDEKSSQ